jgi:hypothetical protein
MYRNVVLDWLSELRLKYEPHSLELVVYRVYPNGIRMPDSSWPSLSESAGHRTRHTRMTVFEENRRRFRPLIMLPASLDTNSSELCKKPIDLKLSCSHLVHQNLVLALILLLFCGVLYSKVHDDSDIPTPV